MEALLKRGFEWIGSAMFTSRRASLTGWTKRREEGGGRLLWCQLRK